jgi:3-phenylpropionate/trans-cinnamate dioxygenase ferredoxin reductase subunit
VADVGVLIVGGGVAGAACAEQLRDGGYDRSILLAGREPDPPYNRPPVTKGYLLGEESREDALVHPPEWWADRDVDLRTRVSVMKLDAAARVATLSTKDEVSFEHALLATGANVRRLPVDGSDLEGIHYLRALRNADVLRDDSADAERVVLVGGSFVGAEAAASLTKLGKRCAIVMQEEVVFERVFGRMAGRWFQSVLEAHGVEIHGGEDLARFEGAGERVEKVLCASGRSSTPTRSSSARARCPT